MQTLVILLALSAGPAPGPPPHLAEAFREVNAARAAVGMPAFLWSPKCAASAQALSDYSWARYTAGTFDSGDSHHGAPERDRAAGIRGKTGECGATATLGPNGWEYPAGTPLDLARITLFSVATGPQAQLILADALAHGGRFREGHVRDFCGPEYARAGVGWRGGMFTIVYGNE